MASVEVYNPATNSWSTLSSSLAANASLVACAALNNSVLVVAGGELYVPSEIVSL